MFNNEFWDKCNAQDDTEHKVKIFTNFGQTQNFKIIKGPLHGDACKESATKAWCRNLRTVEEVSFEILITDSMLQKIKKKNFFQTSKTIGDYSLEQCKTIWTKSTR